MKQPIDEPIIYRPALVRHPIHPKEYADLINQREKAVGTLLFFLEKELDSKRMCTKSQKRYDTLVAAYRTIMRKIEKMERMEELVNLNTDKE